MSGPLEETQGTRTLRTRQRFWAGALRFFARLELVVDKAVWGLRRRFGRLGPLQIVTYRGFGTREHAVVRGRLLEASVLERSLPADTAFRNFRRMLRRFFSREVPDATLKAALGATAVGGTTDDEGYFDLPVSAPALPSRGSWQTAEVEVVSTQVRGLVPTRAAAEILIPGDAAELGVISDIDDTVLQTHVTQTLKLYLALAAGVSGHADNPVFYVSKSPWNLYDFLVDFMDHHQLPRGPLLLRDIGLREAPPVDHKSAAVRQLLDTYKSLPFVLIGDSGERDPEIYLETAARYPGRIRAIYIRDLGGKNRKQSEGRAQTLCERAQAYGTEMLWIEHASQALAHARKNGLTATS
jgi:phosphatidate phosphatase APP1